MKLVRLLLVGTAALAVLLGIAVVAAFNPRVQTWAARRALASRPALGATLGTVAAGLGRVEIRNLRVESRGAVLTLPAVEVELPLLAAGLKNRITITRLVAKGWTLDLTKVVQVGQIFDRDHRPGSPAVAEFSLLTSARAGAPEPAAAAAQLFQGLFAQLGLPVDLALDGVDLAGEIILPTARGHARFALTGGGLSENHEGRFELALTASLTSTTVSTLETNAVFTATMDTPRSFTRFGVTVDSTASGPQFPRGVKLSAATTATRTAAGETYAITLATAGKQLVDVHADFPLAARKLAGTWKIDARDSDLAPFVLGRVPPPFVAAGEGQFDFDASFAEVHAQGKLSAASDNLAAVRPELAALGALRLTADFDLAQIAGQIRVEHFVMEISGARPVVTVNSLQTVTYNYATRGLTAADPARDLFAVTLLGVPLAWPQPFMKDIVISGGDLKGGFVATATDGGFSLRPKAPLMAAGVSVAQAGKPLLREVDLSLNASVDYTPQGWQVVAAPLVFRSGEAAWLTLEARAGQLAGPNQPIKVAGKISAALPALLSQPVASGAVQLTRGDAAVEFAANLGVTQEIQTKLAFTNLETDPTLTPEKLPAISADLRADRAANGQITLNAPLLVDRDGRKSDLVFAGTLTPDAKGLTIAARISSTKLVIEDVKILAAPLASTSASVPSSASTSSTTAPVRDAAPAWAGVSGQIALALKEVVYSGTFQATEVTGTLRIDAGTVKFDGMRAGLGNGSDAKFSGAVTFDANAVAPYALNADLAVTDFDPAPLFKALNPGQPATVEGKFNVTSKLSGAAARLDEFSTTTRGDFQLSSKGGVFRGLPVSVSEKNEAVGRLAASVAMVGSALDALKGRKDDSEITSTAKAVSEVSRMFAAIPYDQLNVMLSRDATLNTVLKDFTLISPEMRLTGGGQTTHHAGTPLLQEALAMEFKLRARGHTGDLLKYLNKLEAQTDALGYAACTLPLKVKGTLGSPDTSELSNAIASLALEKGGVKDKASDLLNKLFGGK